MARGYKFLVKSKQEFCFGNPRRDIHTSHVRLSMSVTLALSEWEEEGGFLEKERPVLVERR